MTDEKRIEILKKAKEKFVDGWTGFICVTLYHLLEAKSLKEVFKIFPELLKYKPKNKRKNQSWWDGEDRKSRIKVLNSMIKEIKAKSND